MRDFDIKEELGSGVGAHNEEKRRDARVRFDADVATYILERRWHDTQVMTQHPDGTVEVQMQVCLSPELDMLLLPWAKSLQILSPSELQYHFNEIGDRLGSRHPKRSKTE